jgi:hypothetical protein
MQKIANALTESVNDDWIEIELNIKVTSGSVGYRGKYLNENANSEQIDFWENDYGLPELFRSLHQTMTADTDKHKWNRAKVTLTDEMNLNIKFEWDQALQDEIDRVSKEYDPRWDDTLNQEQKDEKYKEMVQSGELPDLSEINIKIEG